LLPRVCDRIVLSAILFLIIFAPLAYGGVDPWAQTIIRTVVLLMIIAWLLKLVYLRDHRITDLPFWLPALLFLLLVVLQLLPMPIALRIKLSPEPLRHSILLPGSPVPGTSGHWTQLSIYPAATWEGLLAFTTCLAFCWVLVNNLRSREAIRFVVVALLAIAGFEAVYGLVEFWSGRQAIFWFSKVHYREEVTGTYINHNHLAGLLAMLTPLAAGVAWIKLSQPKGIEGAARMLSSVGESLPSEPGSEVSRNRLRPSITRGRTARVWTGGFVKRYWDLALSMGAFTAMLLGLILSFSRGGQIACVIAITWLMVSLARQGLIGKNWRSWVCLTVVVGCIVFLFRRDIATRFSYVVRDAPERLELWGDGLMIVRDFRFFGTGLGTFKYVLPNYRSKLDFLTVDGVPRRAVWNFAHNDYLQLLIECGIIGFGLVLWAGYLTMRTLSHWRQEPAGRERLILSRSALAGVIAMLLHSIVDFNLHIPGNALVFATLLSLVLVSSRPSHLSQRWDDRTRELESSGESSDPARASSGEGSRGHAPGASQ